jgi:hypothetical protein
MTFRHSKKWYFWAKWIAKILGGVFCVAPALLATVLNFPMMVTKNTDSTVSIVFIFAILISSFVVLHAMYKSFKNNTLLSVSLILAVLCGVFICVWLMEKDTIKGFAWVSGCAAVGTLFAVVCFKLHDMWDDLYKHCGEVYVNNGTNT